MNTPILQAASNYSERGFSVIPIKPDKKPYLSWTEFQERKPSPDEIMTWFTKWPNAMIGIVTGEISNLFVIDCDTREGLDAILKELPKDISYPISQTPRGGWHLYFQNFEQSKTATGIIPGVDIRGEGGYIILPPSVNAECKAYSWMPGFSLDDFAPPPLNCEPLKASIIYNNNSLYKGDVVNSVVTAKFFTEGRRDDDLFHAANSLIKSGCDIAYVWQVLEMLARTSNPPFPENEVKSKIESALKRTERHERNLTAEIREWVLTTTGNFLSTDVNKELQLTTRDNMKVAAVVLGRLCDGKDPLIERYGNKRGSYRRIDKEFERMDIMAASGEEYKIKLPLDLHEEGILYPGNLGIIAGSKESSKTAMMLNIAKLNLGKRRIVYLNSEMGVNEFRNRLLNFDDVPLETWNTQMEIYRMKSSQSPADFIDGSDTIWLIDYLEIAEDFSKIALPITQIHEKLGKGLAFIAIQKADGKDVGRGADFSREKARLYLSLDWDHSKRMNRVKIIDFKAWRGKNPRGLMRYYKLVMGARIIPQGNWEE